MCESESKNYVHTYVCTACIIRRCFRYMLSVLSDTMPTDTLQVNRVRNSFMN